MTANVKSLAPTGQSTDEAWAYLRCEACGKLERETIACLAITGGRYMVCCDEVMEMLDRGAEKQYRAELDELRRRVAADRLEAAHAINSLDEAKKRARRNYIDKRRAARIRAQRESQGLFVLPRPRA